MTDHQLSRNELLFSCHPIGQLCPGGPGYSTCGRTAYYPDPHARLII